MSRVSARQARLGVMASWPSHFHRPRVQQLRQVRSPTWAFDRIRGARAAWSGPLRKAREVLLEDVDADVLGAGRREALCPLLAVVAVVVVGGDGREALLAEDSHHAQDEESFCRPPSRR